MAPVLRKLFWSGIGTAATVGTDERAAPPSAPSGPQLGERPKPAGNGPNPFVVVGAALVLGVVAARVIAWRGHVHPRG
jgi:hypothetical protein